MKFKEQEGPYLVSRIVSENGLIEMGIFPVIYGMRIRAGFVGEFSYNFDYCAGADQFWLETLYSILKSILENRNEDINCFRNFPFQDVKPIMNDPECIMKLTAMAQGDVTVVKLPLISVLRDSYFKDNIL